MRLLTNLIFLFVCMKTYGDLTGHQQLLVVTTLDWDKTQGELALYERANDDSAWEPVRSSIPVVLGENGLAWGIGLHPMEAGLACKKEGDGKSPAGIFALGHAFGFAPSSDMQHLAWEYFPLHQYLEAVDDPLSRYYNCIVDRREVVPDWCNSEKMSEEPLYAAGLVVHHNFPNPKSYAGSAVFLHLWRSETSGTTGCTAMAEENLQSLLAWLHQSKNPVLVQLPIHEYRRLQRAWELPQL